MNTIQTVGVAALFAALSLCAAPSYAEDPSISVKVSVAGLDLNSEAGAKIMLKRLHAAAETVCGVAPEFKQIDLRGIYDNCVSQAFGNAVTVLGNPMVTAAAGGRRGERPIVLSAVTR